MVRINYVVVSCFFLHSYEAKRLEIEKWLQRMESRLEQMGKIATTVDVLEAQQKEQKVLSTNSICVTNPRVYFCL